MSRNLPLGSWFRWILHFFNVESIRGFTSTFVAIYYATSFPFVITSRSKLSPLDILKFLVTTFKNQDKKVVFILVHKDGALSRSSEFMNTCNNMNIIGQTAGVYASSFNGEIEIPNKTLANITRDILLNWSHKKELWWLSYQYDIWISRQTENILCSDVPNFLWYVSRPS